MNGGTVEVQCNGFPKREIRERREKNI